MYFLRRYLMQVIAWCNFVWHIDGFAFFKDDRLLLIISFDGFRYDYLDIVKKAGFSTPNFNALIDGGVTVQSPGVKNAFETVTFPNHFTIATGMYEETHGVISNSMFDPRFNKTFDIPASVTDPFWFTNGSTNYSSQPQPIWITNEISTDTNRHSGVFFWPGSEVPYRNNTYPYHYESYNDSYSNESRIDTVISWFTDTSSPINLALLYFSEPDHLGHQVGPFDQKMVDMIVALDALVGYLINKLKEVDLFDRMNLIITSDHGMAKITGYVAMNSHIDPQLYERFGSATVWNILPNNGLEDELYNKLKNIPNIDVYKKFSDNSNEQIPRQYHYTYNARILALLVVAHPGYVLCHNATVDCNANGGTHGYNNSDSEMHPIFIAHGPSFKVNYAAPVFENVDIYPLMCHLLGLNAPTNIDGNFDRVQNMLTTESDDNDHERKTIFLIFISLVLLGSVLILTYAAIIKFLEYSRQKQYTPLHSEIGK